MHDRRGIHGRAHTLSRLEPHLAGGSNGRLIEPMTQAAYHAIHMQSPVRTKQHFEKNFSLQLELPGFLRVNRTGLGDNFHLRGRWAAIDLCYFGSAVRNFLRSESRCLHRATVISIVALGNPISETCAGDGALQAFRSTRSVAGALAFGQIKGTQLGGGEMGIFLTLTFQAFRIAESSGLHLLYWSADGGGC